MNKSFKDFAEENPSLCTSDGWVENDEFLSRIGIRIPNKELLPYGFVKFLPQDFIVEEITDNEAQCTVDLGQSDILSKSVVGETVFATLVKYNISTFHAIHLLANALGCKESQIQYAGIKDQRALTAQRISLRKVDIKLVKEIAHQIPEIALKDICAGKGVLQPGSLYGNRFTLLIRTSKELFSEATSAVFLEQYQHILNNGFYNFFYLQRFGAPRYINYTWGRSIALGDYESAVKSILLESTKTELPFFVKIRKMLEPMWEDWEQMRSCLQEFVPSDVFMHELQIIEHLCSYPADYLGALKLMPQQVQLWVYAYSSRLHNQQLSYLLSSKKVLPNSLPVALSSKFDDTKIYRYLMQQDGTWPPKWPSLREFPTVQRRSQSIRTQSSVQIQSVDVTEVGIKLQFTLKKGEYATTFLSHLFNLLGGKLDSHNLDISREDTAEIPAETKDYFAELIRFQGT